MGTRTYAEIEVYPFNRDALSCTAAGREFLERYDAVVEWHEVEDSSITDGHLITGLDEVNYGTNTFDDERLPELASAAGLWYRDSDAGGGTWGQHRRTVFPNGVVIDPLVDNTGSPLLSHDDYRRIAALDSAWPLAERVEAYFTLCSTSLPGLAAKAVDGSLATKMAALGLQPVEPKDLERRADADDLGPPEPPLPLRGPGSNQYEDKPPLPR